MMYCKGCEYRRVGGYLGMVNLCVHPEVCKEAECPVNGIPPWTYCEEARKKGKACGPEGKYYEVFVEKPSRSFWKTIFSRGT